MRANLVGLTVVGCLLALQPPARATWSVVAVNTRTGEIGVGQATCIVGENLQRKLAVILPGVGAGCVQQWWDFQGEKREAIWDGLQSGLSPQEIIEAIQHRSFQFGIVDQQGRSATYTGNAGGSFAGGVALTVGELTFAIQGNVLAGDNVVDSAAAALVNTPGSMPEKLMAAMLAAARAGGDGRCSCAGPGADSCGSPPPGFDLESGKSAHTGFMIVARVGDSTGVCSRSTGCANGAYFLNFNTTGQVGPPDPIAEMQTQFPTWKASLAARPDQLESRVGLSRSSVPGNRPARVWMRIDLKDYFGQRVRNRNVAVSVNHAGDSSGLASIGPVLPRGPGRFAVRLEVGAGQGLDRFEVLADDGNGPILLYPFPTLAVGESLVAFGDSLSASSGGSVQLDLFGPARLPGAEYLVLGSLSGTQPGIDLGSTTLPLNPDWFLTTSYWLRNSELFSNTESRLSPEGRGQAGLSVPAGLFMPLVGRELSLAFLLTDQVDFASQPVTIRIDP